MTFLYGFVGGVAGGMGVLAGALLAVRKAIRQSPFGAMIQKPKAPSVSR